MLATIVLAASMSPDTALLQSKVRAALRAAKSFVATVTIKPQAMAPAGGTIVYTIVAPNKYRQAETGLPDSDDTIIYGLKVYGNKGSGWDVQTWDQHLVSGFEGTIFDVEVVSTGPDRVVDGIARGTFVMKDPNGKDSDTQACTYDKQTYRPLECTASYGVTVYARYDDPTVTIPIPAHAKDLTPG